MTTNYKLPLNGSRFWLDLFLEKAYGYNKSHAYPESVPLNRTSTATKLSCNINLDIIFIYLFIFLEILIQL